MAGVESKPPLVAVLRQRSIDKLTAAAAAASAGGLSTDALDERLGWLTITDKRTRRRQRRQQRRDSDNDNDEDEDDGDDAVPTAGRAPIPTTTSAATVATAPVTKQTDTASAGGSGSTTRSIPQLLRQLSAEARASRAAGAANGGSDDGDGEDEVDDATFVKELLSSGNPYALGEAKRQYTTIAKPVIRQPPTSTPAAAARTVHQHVSSLFGDDRADDDAASGGAGAFEFDVRKSSSAYRDHQSTIHTQLMNDHRVTSSVAFHSRGTNAGAAEENYGVDARLRIKSGRLDVTRDPTNAGQSRTARRKDRKLSTTKKGRKALDEREAEAKRIEAESEKLRAAAVNPRAKGRPNQKKITRSEEDKHIETTKARALEAAALQFDNARYPHLLDGALVDPATATVWVERPNVVTSKPGIEMRVAHMSRSARRRPNFRARMAYSQHAKRNDIRSIMTKNLMLQTGSELPQVEKLSPL